MVVDPLKFPDAPHLVIPAEYGTFCLCKTLYSDPDVVIFPTSAVFLHFLASNGINIRRNMKLVSMNLELKPPIPCPPGGAFHTYRAFLEPIMQELYLKHEDWCVTVTRIKPRLRGEVFCLDQLCIYINAHAGADVSDANCLGLSGGSFSVLHS